MSGVARSRPRRAGRRRLRRPRDRRRGRAGRRRGGPDRSAAAHRLRPHPAGDRAARPRTGRTTRWSTSRAICRCSTRRRFVRRWPGSPTPETDIATLAAVIEDDAALADTSVNKVVAGFADPTRPARALYFSKAVVPWGDGPHYEHIGLYAYRRDALERFVGLPPRRARTARTPRAIARARSRDAHLGQPDRGRPARRTGRHPGRSRTRPRIDAEIRQDDRTKARSVDQAHDRVPGSVRGLFRPRLPPGLSRNGDAALRPIRGCFRRGARRPCPRWR